MFCLLLSVGQYDSQYIYIYTKKIKQRRWGVILLPLHDIVNGSILTADIRTICKSKKSWKDWGPWLDHLGRLIAVSLCLTHGIIFFFLKRALTFYRNKAFNLNGSHFQKCNRTINGFRIAFLIMHSSLDRRSLKIMSLWSVQFDSEK